MKTTIYKIIGSVLLVTACIATSSVFANTTKSELVTTQSTAPIPVATAAQAKMIQDFQHGDLSVQFRYENGKMVGLRLMNKGTDTMQVNLLNKNYILGPNDYVILNPPSSTDLQIYHSKYSEPLSVMDVLFPTRFGGDETYIIPKNIANTEPKQIK